MVKIGIRPVKDEGRRTEKGAEETAMKMARKAARLISREARDADGKPVECVLPDETIANRAQAAACTEKFDRAGGVCAVLTVADGWANEEEPADAQGTLPQALWALHGTRQPGTEYLARTMEQLAQNGTPAFAICGTMVEERCEGPVAAGAAEKILRFAKAAAAAGQMKGGTYLGIGTRPEKIGNGFRASFCGEYLGMHAKFEEAAQINKRVASADYDTAEYQRATRWVRENYRENEDLYNRSGARTGKELGEDWKACVKMTLVVRDMLRENNAVAAGVEGEPSEAGSLPGVEVTGAILNSCFDWNGPRRPFLVSAREDCMDALSMLFGHLVTNTPPMDLRLRTCWSAQSVRRITDMTLDDRAENGMIHMVNSGSAPPDVCGAVKTDEKPCVRPFWEMTKNEIRDCLDAVAWTPADLARSPGGGFTNTFSVRGDMPATIIRLSYVKRLGPVLTLTEGYACRMNRGIVKSLTYRTEPGWASVFFAPVISKNGPFTDGYSVMSQWGSDRAAMSYGHIGAELITLASMLRIPVAAHNIARDQIFRPAVWSAFGTDDLQGADFRACRAYGPLYG